MIRILHLLDYAEEFEAERGSETLATALGAGFDVTVRTIGYGGDWRDIPTAATVLRRAGDAFDLVHAWGGPALAAGTLGARCPIVFSPASVLKKRLVGWLRAILAHRRIEVACPTSTMRRILVERGVPIERCHLIRPGVDFSRIRRRRDPELRAKLGLADSDYVFLAAGESTRHAGHAQAVWAISILHVVDPKYKLLVWGKGPAAESIRRLAFKTTPGALSVAGDQSYEELHAAADAIVVTATGPVSTLPIAVSMASALPIIATVTPTVAELLEDRHTALMTANKPRVIARRALDLLEEPSQQWSLCDMARTEAYEYFANTRFVNQFRQLYQQTTTQDRVELSPLAAGAGLRFHGRG